MNREKTAFKVLILILLAGLAIYGAISYIADHLFFPSLVLFVFTLCLTKRKCMIIVPWLMLATNITIFLWCMSFLNVTEGLGPLKFSESVATVLLFAMTYTFFVFWSLNFLLSEEAYDIDKQEISKSRSVSILSSTPFLLSIFFMLYYILYVNYTSDRFVIPTAMFVTSYFLLIIYEIYQFLRRYPKTYDMHTQERRERYKSFRDRVVRRKEAIYAISLALLVVLGSAVFFSYYENTMDLYSEFPSQSISGDLIYEENESDNDTAAFTLILDNPEKAEHDEIYILLQDENYSPLSFTYDIKDNNMNGYVDTGDKIEINLTEGELPEHFLVRLGISDYFGSISYSSY